ncbi:Polysaccharide deacetylase [Listeria newyorkensis]|nr:polysaccharide deacetylase family protein [Listeria newyorkensis]SQC59191.1 Polysaccharide deacetylase [Listeria newyorkensis]
MKKKLIVIASILLLIPCLVVGASFFLKSADVAKVDKKTSKQEPPRQQAPKQASEHKIAYLTIDDGPTKYMSAIVAALKKENVKATFSSLAIILQETANRQSKKPPKPVIV